MIEVAVATAIIALALAISYPSVSEGIEAARLRTAADRAGTLLLDCQQFASRHRQAVLVSIVPGLSRIEALSEDGAWQRTLDLPKSLRIVAPAKRATLIVQPWGALPQVQLAIASSRGARSGFRTDPLEGTILHWVSGE